MDQFIIPAQDKEPEPIPEYSDTYPLDNRWTVWYHAVNNEDWSMNSYMKLCTISSLKDLHALFNTVPNVTAGMFFVMREGIKPMWEDDANANGGLWTFKVHKKHANNTWKKLVTALVCENLYEDMEEITGISFSPKLSNTIMKIWNRNATKSYKNKITSEIEFINPNECRYRKHN